MAILNSDPIAAKLLDFISIKESNGNYNAFIGHANSTDDLSANTVNGIYIFQRRLISWGEPSSAIGRYQFIQRTLSSLIQRSNIPFTSRFTPLLQDQLAIMLLDDRGFAGWKAGTISNETFAHNLSCEWASLPDPLNGGKSHYDGVGPNHAGQTLETVYMILNNAKGV